MILSSDVIITKMFFALIVGTIIGFERSKANKPAGIRTHSLVCIAFTMMTIISVYGFAHLKNASNNDPARLIAQAVTGIGFLGAGIIWKHNSEIRGLTTAANVWTVAGLGVAIGLGHYYLVFITVIFMLLALKMASILRFLGILKTNKD